ncbi:glycosyltransferase 61 family protein [Methylobacterium sp. 37f]|uniref:glycosyltransferase 61 family protein n=1 Tax=Methylobacterium sp. 37f TaxID=2817058 RepID=UPI001FFD91C0|nr:glycosyltransferase 61 family protein [Methylobacterium sp. 37f]MCK2055467.1 glycosyltransferase family 61 protein [Methylobacterium sp. 37f]
MQKMPALALSIAAARSIQVIRGLLIGAQSARARSGRPKTQVQLELLALIRPLFDDAWYIGAYPEAAKQGNDPRIHYLSEPEARYDAPHPLFDGAWYLAQHPDVEAAGTHPLLHYLQTGAALGYAPHPLFDGAWYLEQHPEVEKAAVNPLIHYLREGACLGFSPSLAFDTAWYLHSNPDVAAAGINPLVHFVVHGIHEGRCPNPLAEAAAFETFARSGDAVRAIRLLDWRQHLLPQDGTVPYVATFRGGQLSDVSDTSAPAAGMAPGSSEGLYYLVPLTDATVIGGTTSLIVSDRFIPTNMPGTRDAESSPTDYPEAWKAGETVVVRFGRRSRTYIPQGIHLTGGDRTFADFLTSLLPRLIAVQSSEFSPELPLLVSASAGERERAAIRLLSRFERTLIPLTDGVAYHTELLHYPVRRDRERRDRRSDAVLHPSDEVAALRQVREQVLSSVTGTAPKRMRRLYVRPTAPLHRSFDNQAFFGALIDRDFEIVDIGDLSFEIQVRLLAASSIVIVHAGDDFTNTIWCHSGAHILVIESLEGENWRSSPVGCVVAELATIHTIPSNFSPLSNDEEPRQAVSLDAMTPILDEMISALRLLPASVDHNRNRLS